MPSESSIPALPEQIRIAERFEAAVPLVLGDQALGGQMALTRNISDSGVYFETDVEQKVGSLINLTLEFQLGGQRQRLECQAQVVRIDRGEHRVGVAARLMAPLFEPIKEDLAL
ncbi:hypothetical protein BH11PSE7_BH11PSE7_31430 [soil metagenome]